MRMLSFNRFVVLCFCVMLSSICTAFALAPHEVFVLANRNEATSVRIARAYMQKRQIPRQNLLLLEIQPNDDGHYVGITRNDFTRQIWQPAQDALARRNLDHILAWVFSTHIPYRVDFDPALSVQGLVYVRDQIPPSDAIAKAEYISPLFAGPSRPDGPAYPARSFQLLAASLHKNMPIPAMALGYIGPRGNTESEVMEMLERSRAADASAPSGTIYFVTGDDVRARVREWQFAPVHEHLATMGVHTLVTNSPPHASEAILGVMMGARDVDPEAMGTYLPGAFAEHLTSYGAVFDQSSQTKVTDWIGAGASATVGTVTEPYAIWAKFPHARFYEHYHAGTSLLESLYLSIRTPLQSFMIGDPLMTPWALGNDIRLAGIRNQEVVREKRVVSPRIDGSDAHAYSRFIYLLNGVVVSVGRTFVLDPAELDSGLHELRVVAYREGNVTYPITDWVRFQITP